MPEKPNQLDETKLKVWQQCFYGRTNFIGMVSPDSEVGSCQLMFDHYGFQNIPFEEIPLNRDIIIMDKKYIDDFEMEWIKTFNKNDEADPYSVGYMSPASARFVGNDWIELFWYPNICKRFHEVTIFLPRSEFVACVDIWEYDSKPTVFVLSKWLTNLHESSLVSFAIVDAIGVKERIRTGNLEPKLLHALRDRIDSIADHYPDFAFISFADSLLVKQIWSVGHVHSTIKYTYAPERLLPVVAELFQAFMDVLDLKAYGIMTQGMNSYSDDLTMHRSGNGNHISLNTLGLPFAQLMAIDKAARKSMEERSHPAAELYLDSTFFRSLRLVHEFKGRLFHYPYQHPMTKSERSTYVLTSIVEIMESLELREP